MKALRDAIHAKLVGDSTFLTLMGSPSAHPYRVFYLTPPEVPTFPEVVFRFEGAPADPESELVLTDPSLVITFYAATDAYHDLADRAIALLKNQTIGTDGTALYMGMVADLYDDEFNVWGRTDRYQIARRRTAI